MKTSKTFYFNQKGSAIIEFAFVLPVLLIMLVGAIEIANYVYAHQKAQTAAENISNIINLQDNVSTTQLRSIASMLPRIVRPFSAKSSQYRVIVTTMQRDEGDDFAYIRWQKSFGRGGGNGRFHYTDGAPKETNTVSSADLDGFVFFPNDQVMVVEVYLFYQTIFDTVFGNDMLGLTDSFIYHSNPAVRPRTGKFYFNPDDLV